MPATPRHAAPPPARRRRSVRHAWTARRRLMRRAGESAAALALLLSVVGSWSPGAAAAAPARPVAAKRAGGGCGPGPSAGRAGRNKAAERRAGATAPARASSAKGRAAVFAAIEAAAGATGNDPALLYAMAWKESRFDPGARNPRSTARGLMQFTRASWLEAVRGAGRRHGLAREAAALAAGRCDGRSLGRILALRDDPRLSAMLAAEQVAGARPVLERTLRRSATPADLYLVHFLGTAGALRLLVDLESAPDRPAGEAVGRGSVAANRNVFLAGGAAGRPRSVGEVHADVARLVGAWGEDRPRPPSAEAGGPAWGWPAREGPERAVAVAAR